MLTQVCLHLGTGTLIFRAVRLNFRLITSKTSTDLSEFVPCGVAYIFQDGRGLLHQGFDHWSNSFVNKRGSYRSRWYPSTCFASGPWATSTGVEEKVLFWQKSQATARDALVSLCPKAPHLQSCAFPLNSSLLVKMQMFGCPKMYDCLNLF